jgi:hypothetical protein
MPQMMIDMETITNFWRAACVERIHETHTVCAACIPTQRAHRRTQTDAQSALLAVTASSGDGACGVGRCSMSSGSADCPAFGRSSRIRHGATRCQRSVPRARRAARDASDIKCEFARRPRLEQMHGLCCGRAAGASGLA